MKTTNTTAASNPAQDEPVGTPPAGGSWQWANGRWERTGAEQTLPEQPAQE
jgi:hypothetical protein